MKNKFKILFVVGARPNFVKIASLLKECKKNKQIETVLVHTGQHYNHEMSKVFFEELNVIEPDYHFEINGNSHIQQIAEIMLKIEVALQETKPNLVVVVGDVNSTLAGALAAVKMNIPVAHVEAGLRSFDISMPEEINRRLVDNVSDFFFITESSAFGNLVKEGVDKEKIYLVGNVMIDTLISLKSKIEKSEILKKLKLKKKDYAVLTLHRPSNVDDLKELKEFMDIFGEIQKKIKIVFLVHPRTKIMLQKLKDYSVENLEMIDSLGYVDCLSLISNSKLVLTDSGGIQEETTALNIPCLTLRENTERPITIKYGTNILCNKKTKILKEIDKILKGKQKKAKIPKFWDGKTSQRIIKIINKKYDSTLVPNKKF